MNLYEQIAKIERLQKIGRKRNYKVKPLILIYNLSR